LLFLISLYSTHKHQIVKPLCRLCIHLFSCSAVQLQLFSCLPAELSFNVHARWKQTSCCSGDAKNSRPFYLFPLEPLSLSLSQSLSLFCPWIQAPNSLQVLDPNSAALHAARRKRGVVSFAYVAVDAAVTLSPLIPLVVWTLDVDTGGKAQPQRSALTSVVGFQWWCSFGSRRNTYCGKTCKNNNLTYKFLLP